MVCSKLPLCLTANDTLVHGLTRRRAGFLDWRWSNKKAPSTALWRTRQKENYVLCVLQCFFITLCRLVLSRGYEPTDSGFGGGGKARWSWRSKTILYGNNSYTSTPPSKKRNYQIVPNKQLLTLIKFIMNSIIIHIFKSIYYRNIFYNYSNKQY